MDLIEHIAWKGEPLACIIRADMTPEKTGFLTPADFNLQVGFVVYPAGGEIPRHAHLPLKRQLDGTSEVLVVKKGRCQIDVYSDSRELVATSELRKGDIVLLIGGGHGFRMLQDTVLLEVKQGPYSGEDEKERF